MSVKNLAEELHAGKCHKSSLSLSAKSDIPLTTIYSIFLFIETNAPGVALSPVLAFYLEGLDVDLVKRIKTTVLVVKKPSFVVDFQGRADQLFAFLGVGRFEDRDLRKDAVVSVVLLVLAGVQFRVVAGYDDHTAVDAQERQRHTGRRPRSTRRASSP